MPGTGSLNCAWAGLGCAARTMVICGDPARKRFRAVVFAAVLAGNRAGRRLQPGRAGQAGDPLRDGVANVRPDTTPRPPHGGVDLDVLVVTDGTPPVEAIGQQLTTEGIPSTVINLHDSSRKAITRAFLARTLPDGSQGRQFRRGRATRPRSCWPVCGRGKRAGLVRAHVPRAPGGRLLTADARHRDEPAGLQRAAQRHHARDQGWGECGVRLPQRLVPVQRRVGRRRAVRLPRRARSGRRRHAAAQSGDPGLVRPRHIGVAVRQPGA